MLSPRIGVITWLRGWLPSLESLPQCVVASVSYPLSTLGWVLMGLEPEFFPAFFTRLSSWEMCWLYLSLALPAHFPGTSTATQVAISSRRRKLAKASSLKTLCSSKYTQRSQCCIFLANVVHEGSRVLLRRQGR